MGAMSTAVVFEQPGEMRLRPVELPEPHSTDCVVEVHWTGISTGTERLLWDGRMPPFPGLAYPLVPGYESVGSVVASGAETHLEVGQRVFVPGSRGFTGVHGLFGGAARSLVVPAERLVSLPSEMESTGVLLALAATACHAVRRIEDLGPPELIIGHGALGRLLARVTEARYQVTPTVWETAAERREGHHSYPVLHPSEDDRRDYRLVCDVSGASGIIDEAVHPLAKDATLVLAGILGLAYTLIEAFTGASPGKRVMGLQVAREDGSKGDVQLYLVRWALKNSGSLLQFVLPLISTLASLVFFFGCFAALGDKKQALHDIIAKTAVYKKADITG